MNGDVLLEHVWQAYRPRTRHGGRRHGVRRWALEDVSLHVGPGELIGVIGGNGSGKTTLLRTIAGVLAPPTRGNVATEGRVASLIDLTAGSHRDLNGYENLMIAGVLLGLRRREVKSLFAEVSQFAGLDVEQLASPLHSYSAGMTLRLIMSLVLHSDPSVLVVDEVLAASDEAFHRACLDRITALRTTGCAIVLVSHDLALVAAECSRGLVLQKGHVVCEGRVGDAIQHYLDLATET